jgi:uncharacterized protein YcbK (DUF882 family)
MEESSHLATSTPECQINSRRKFLGVLGAGAAGLILVPGELPAAPWPNSGAAGSPMWNQFLNEYAAYLAKQRFRNISVKQVIDAHMKMRGTVRNTPPPRSMWKNIVPALRVIDRIASELRAPVVEIVSAYRSPSYNARCPGAKRESMHTRNLAVDVKLATSPRNVAAMADRLRGKRYFKGGIGRYSSFTHIDTRGENVDWRG